MKVKFGWEDSQSAQVIELICDCGYEVEDEEIFSDEETWTCPKCGKTIIFKWVGMTWQELKEES